MIPPGPMVKPADLDDNPPVPSAEINDLYERTHGMKSGWGLEDLKQYCYDHPMMSMTVDIVVIAANRTKLLLVERKNEPWKGRKALPGGFVEHNETIVEAARRELREETGLVARDFTSYLGFFDKPNRDPRGRIVTHAFLLDCGDIIPYVVGMDDASNAVWVTQPGFENLTHEKNIAADHPEIVGNALGWGSRGVSKC